MLQEFVEELGNNITDMLGDVHTAVPAVIIAYDPASNRATVQPKAKFKEPSGEKMDYPSISGVPVVFPHGKDFSLSFPIQAGDGCLLVFAENALDYWLYGKDTDTDLKFDLSSAIAIPNITAQGEEAMTEACRDRAVIVKTGKTTLKITDNGIEIESDRINLSGDVTVRGNFTTTGGIVNLN